MAANEKAAQVLLTPEAAHQNPQADFNPDAYFEGSVTRRQIKLIMSLQLRPTAREELDWITGASNSPAIVMGLRKRGLDLPCQRVDAIDKYGQPCRPGIYSLSADDRIKLNIWGGRA